MAALSLTNVLVIKIELSTKDLGLHLPHHMFSLDNYWHWDETQAFQHYTAIIFHSSCQMTLTIE